MTAKSPEKSATSNLSALYEGDYNLWLEKTAQILREGRLDELDLANLMEEIEDMSRSQKDALESNLCIVLMHLLKYKYQPEKRSNSWRYTLREHRRRIIKALKNSLSLKRYFEEALTECYEDGRKLAADETGLPLGNFPPECPFTPEQILDSEYLPV